MILFFECESYFSPVFGVAMIFGLFCCFGRGRAVRTDSESVGRGVPLGSVHEGHREAGS